MLFAVSAAGYLLSLLKEILVASSFGIGVGMDAFYAAVTIPYAVSGVVGSLLTGVFIPLFMEYRREGADKAAGLANAVFTWMSVVLLGITVTIFAAAPQMTAFFFPGLNPETALLTAKLLRATSLLVFLSNCVYFSVSVLNAEKKFALPAVSNMLVTAFTIVCVLTLTSFAGIWALAAGLVGGGIAQFWLLDRAIKKLGHPGAVSFDARHPGLARMRRSGAILILALLVGHLNILIDRYMASGLPPGSLGTFGYATRLTDVLLQVFCFSAATAAFPYFIADAVGKNIGRLEESFISGIRMLGFALIPVTAFFAIFSLDVVQVLFQRGAFGPEAAAATAATFAASVLQLFFVGAVILSSRVFFAFGAMWTMLQVNAASVVLKVLFNLAGMKFIDPPIAGIALSMAATYLVLTALCFWILRRKWFRGMRIGRMLAGLAGMAAAALPAAALLAWLSFGFRADIAALGVPARLLFLAAAAAVLGGSYLAAGSALKLDEAASVLSRLRSYLPPGGKP